MYQVHYKQETGDTYYVQIAQKGNKLKIVCAELLYFDFDSVQFLHDLTIFVKNPVAMRSTQRGVHWIS